MAADLKDDESDDEPLRIILHEGYLNKKGQINRSWKKRLKFHYSHYIINVLKYKPIIIRNGTIQDIDTNILYLICKQTDILYYTMTRN